MRLFIRGCHGSNFARDIPAFGGFQPIVIPNGYAGEFEVLFPANPSKLVKPEECIENSRF